MELNDYLNLPYTITLRPDSDGDWIAEIEELEGCVAHGETQGEALERIDEAKRLWIEESLSNGQPVPQPSATEILPSGRWVQRAPRSLHKNLTRLAKVEGTSLNQLVTSILSAHVGAIRRSKETTSASLGFVTMPVVLMGSELIMTLLHGRVADYASTGNAPPVEADIFEKV